MRIFLILLLVSVTSLAAENPGAEHPGIDEFVQRAVTEHGLVEEDVRALLQGAQYKQSIVDAISRPAEARAWYEYRPIFLTEKRIDEGIDFWLENRELIAAAAKEFGVDAEIIVAIIGVETSYGRITGGYRTIDALFTLAFHYPGNLSSDRTPFFTSELMHYIQLASEEGLPADQITGSYAGAMGIGQFMPSSYREYAVDFDGDGRRDLWRSMPDVVGSVANYLRRHGWQPGALVAERARAAQDAAFADMATRNFIPTLSVAEWREKGFRSLAALPPQLPATVLQLEEKDHNTYWLTFRNFYVITRYNRSPKYAMAVFELSQEISKGMDQAG